MSVEEIQALREIAEQIRILVLMVGFSAISICGAILSLKRRQ